MQDLGTERKNSDEEILDCSSFLPLSRQVEESALPEDTEMGVGEAKQLRWTGQVPEDRATHEHTLEIFREVFLGLFFSFST